MNKILILALALMSTAVMANHHNSGFNHMIEFNTGGFGADYSTGTVEVGGSDVDVTNLELAVNYAHKIANNIWIQGILGYEVENTESTGSDDDETTINLTIAGIYNFSHDVTNSFYGKIGYNIMMFSEEDNTNSTKEDTDANQFFVEFGKRWSLEQWTGIKNISYVASINYATGSGEIDTGATTDIDVSGLTLTVLGIHLFF